MPSKALVARLMKARLPASAYQVLFCLLIHVRRANGQCFPSIKRIAVECGLSERVVKDAIRRLESDGIIRHVSGGRGTRGNRANTYLINDWNYHAKLFDRPVEPNPSA